MESSRPVSPAPKGRSAQKDRLASLWSAVRLPPSAGPLRVLRRHLGERHTAECVAHLLVAAQPAAHRVQHRTDGGVGLFFAALGPLAALAGKVHMRDRVRERACDGVLHKLVDGRVRGHRAASRVEMLRSRARLPPADGRALVHKAHMPPVRAAVGRELPPDKRRARAARQRVVMQVHQQPAAHR
eukprot:870613-Prymnesium_polylepis.1